MEALLIASVNDHDLVGKWLNDPESPEEKRERESGPYVTALLDDAGNHAETENDDEPPCSSRLNLRPAMYVMAGVAALIFVVAVMSGVFMYSNQNGMFSKRSGASVETTITIEAYDTDEVEIIACEDDPLQPGCGEVPFDGREIIEKASCLENPEHPLCTPKKYTNLPKHPEELHQALKEERNAYAESKK